MHVTFPRSPTSLAKSPLYLFIHQFELENIAKSLTFKSSSPTNHPPLHSFHSIPTFTPPSTTPSQTHPIPSEPNLPNLERVEQTLDGKKRGWGLLLHKTRLRVPSKWSGYDISGCRKRMEVKMGLLETSVPTLFNGLSLRGFELCLYEGGWDMLVLLFL